MPKTIRVGIADLQVTTEPNILMTLGLGSCVGICLWDRTTRVAGLSHIMLPNSSDSRKEVNEMKYADTALDIVLEDMVDLGARKSRIVAKIAGGAHMFSTIDTNNAPKIGDLNVAAVKEKLKELKINIIAEDTGDDYGRTVELHSTNGKVLVKTAMRGINEL
ncbi:MAG: chemotaxis protein CheD [Halobacteriota archaeon]|nr:chemotaxis protein CheD [Halobacteriota archaeon]